jgi:DNA replication protein DnaC
MAALHWIGWQESPEYARYEQGALILTSNRAFKEWPTIFNHDSTLTSAVLDRLLHHADTIIIEGKSFRMKDQLES